ncbi:neprilysin-1-like [Haliotis cracherodii]|uniref:neprilysin-1-like n=1 Tax=Haliotis cracherodii TaxID=6455 RepID=UPI0039E90B7B
MLSSLGATLVFLQGCASFHTLHRCVYGPLDARRFDEQQRPQQPPGMCLTKECIQHANNVWSRMNRSADPCEDFFEYSCGGWVRSHPIPDDRSFYDTIALLHDVSQRQLRDLMEAAGSMEDPESMQRARTLYNSCVDEDTIELKGTLPVLDFLRQYGGWPLLQRGDNLPITIEDLIATATKDFMNVIVTISVSEDLKNSSRMVIYLDQTWLGMGNRGYFLQGLQDKLLVAYRTFIRNVATELGADQTTIDADVEDLIDFEVNLANISIPMEERRDYNALYTKRTVGEMSDLYPVINWLSLLQLATGSAGVNIRKGDDVIDFSEGYFQQLGPLLQNTPLRVIQNYVVWRFMRKQVTALPQVFQTYEKEFKEVVIGVTSLPPRWHSCLQVVDSFMPYVVGRMFVQEHFLPTSKNDVTDAIRYVKDAFRQKLDDITWMDEQTKDVARDKLASMTSKIGYPDELYNTTYLDNMYQFEVEEGEYFKNVASGKRMRTAMEWRKLLKPSDKSLWMMSPAVVNAYYNPSSNEIVIMAALLQPPLFSPGLPKYVNYGAYVASVLGHELTHGFDDVGRLFDKNGNLVEWWSTDVIKAFKDKAQCFIDQYSQYHEASVNVSVNGINTQGENIADCGGVKQAYRAYRNLVGDLQAEEPLLPYLGLSQDQAFFISYAQSWCASYRKEGLEATISGDVHSPNMYRIIGACQNSFEFAEAFRCPVGSYMNPPTKCELW